MDTDAADHSPIVQKPYTLPLEQYKWVWNKMEMLKKARIISHVFHTGLNLLL